MRFLILSSLLSSFQVMAMPAVGDYALFASYDGYIRDAEVLSYDKTSNQFQVRYTTKFEDMIITDDIKSENSSDMITEEKIEFLLEHCEAEFQGRREMLELSMGNFETCKLTDIDTKESFNVGRVPFGVLAMELVMDAEPDATFKKFTLQKFRDGIK